MIRSGFPLGVDAQPVDVDAKVIAGRSTFNIVGLPAKEINESRRRVQSALNSSGFQWPAEQIIVNLAPADLPKFSTFLDLAIAVSILQASSQIPQGEPRWFLVGELGLQGELKRVRGILTVPPIVTNNWGLIVPEANRQEAALAVTERPVSVCCADSLRQAVSILTGKRETKPVRPKEFKYTRARAAGDAVDLSHVVGQTQAKRALEVAAAGGHNLLFEGPPGEGKSMLAQVLPSIMPSLTDRERVELTRIYSSKGLLGQDEVVYDRPFRAIHHTASKVAVVGGGTGIPEPGEISLAHRGVLFMDELPEFPRSTLEALRQPLEDGKITVARGRATLAFPARFTLVAAMNPCPCGMHGEYTCEACHEQFTQPNPHARACPSCGSTEVRDRCICPTSHVNKYRQRISGPLLDRIDMHVRCSRVPTHERLSAGKTESSDVVQERVEKARQRQLERFRDSKLLIQTNAEIPTGALDRLCARTSGAENLYRRIIQYGALSMRAQYRLLRVARTVADLQGSEKVGEDDIREAVELASPTGLAALEKVERAKRSAAPASSKAAYAAPPPAPRHLSRQALEPNVEAVNHPVANAHALRDTPQDRPQGDRVVPARTPRRNTFEALIRSVVEDLGDVAQDRLEREVVYRKFGVQRASRQRRQSVAAALSKAKASGWLACQRKYGKNYWRLSITSAETKTQTIRSENARAVRRVVIIADEAFPVNIAKDILVVTAEWLIGKGHIRASDCPIVVSERGAEAPRRYLINTDRVHPTGRDFFAPNKLSNGTYIETHASRQLIEQEARQLLRWAGYEDSILRIDWPQ